jgi:hypothetical protein
MLLRTTYTPEKSKKIVSSNVEREAAASLLLSVPRDLNSPAKAWSRKKRLKRKNRYRQKEGSHPVGQYTRLVNTTAAKKERGAFERVRAMPALQGE